jgi:carbonyl reductase 1
MLEAQRGSQVLVNACCPGYVKTDMTRGGGMISPDEGAQTPVMLALGDIDNTSGEFWKSKKVQSW